MQKNHTFYVIVLSLTTSLAFGQKSFTINNSSKIYNAKIQVTQCENETCNGKGTVQLFSKDNSKLIQTFQSDDLYFNLDNNMPSTKMELYDEQSPLVFGDFNFDNSEDIAIRNGNNSGYGGPSYDVYVYNITKKQFVLSKELTELASTNLGLFEVDQKRKRIITFTKSGCCWHQSIEYEVIPKKGLVAVNEITEEVNGDDFVLVTKKTLTKGKWVKTTKKYKTKDYYKD